MNLYQLSRTVDSVILDRGKDYLLKGHVRSLEQTGPMSYCAMVEGSDMYRVDVELEDDGTVASAECDCPYDFGPVCKHQAAVLLMFRDRIRDHLQDGGLRDESGGPDVETGEDRSGLRKRLEAESKERLIHILLSISSDSDLIEQRIRLFLSEANGERELEQCRELIRSHIRAHADHHGFVTWRQVTGAAGGADMAAAKAAEAADAAIGFLLQCDQGQLLSCRIAARIPWDAGKAGT